MDDAMFLGVIRLLVSQGLSISDALQQLTLEEDQRSRLRTMAEKELGGEAEVGPGISHRYREPWVDARNIRWFHWERLRQLWVTDGKLSAGAIRTIDRASRVILDNMPPPDLSEFDWKGMIVGSVQSGKTANFAALISKAADTGYRLFIVLSGLLKSLRLQTQLRLSREILGSLELGGIPMPPGKKWHMLTADRLDDGDFSIPGGMNVDLLQSGQPPTIAVVKKNVLVMENLNTWLDNMRLEHPEVFATLPVLIVDDESDEASIDTGRDGKPSSTNRELRRLLTLFKKRAYIGFTATPYANCFIPSDKEHLDWGKDLYPKDYILPLEPSASYTSSEVIFGRQPVWDESEVEAVPGLYQEVPEEERKLLIPSRKEKETFQPARTPSLRTALLSFLLAGAARLCRGEIKEPCIMLVHIDVHTRQHEKQKRLIEDFFDEVYGCYAARNGLPALERELKQLWEESFIPTIRGLNPGQILEFDRVRTQVFPFLQVAREVKIVNKDSDDVVDFVRQPGLKAVVVGGQNLGRGLTLEGLVTTFFLRHPGNQSTAMQMQRWCGYRQKYVDLVKVFATAAARDYFREFLAIEREMRDELKKYERERLSPLEVGMRLRQHPDIPLVSASKAGARRSLSDTYAGKLPQTTVFPMDDLELLDRNVSVTKSLVTRLKETGGASERLPTGHWLWRDVDVSEVLRYLQEFEYPSHGERPSFHREHLHAYISGKCRDAGHLTLWTVAICGRQNEKEGCVDLGLPELVKRRWRGATASNRHRIGIITEPRDEAIDLPASEDLGLEARAKRPPENGLMLIYPLRHPEQSGVTIVGVAFSFSTQLEDRGRYVAGSVPTEGELAEQ